MNKHSADLSASFSDKLLSLLLYPLPQHLLSRLVFFLTRLKTPITTSCIRWFIKKFNVNMAEAADSNPAAYPTFNEFFTRELKPGARTIADGEKILISPVDGAISQLGSTTEGNIIQAKDHHYSVSALLGGQQELATGFKQGSFATLYLSPRDYHRIHMPLSGKLRTMLYVPGRLFSVAPHTVRAIPGLFARNERVVCIFDSEHGPFVMALVGAINVAAIETVWHGLVTPPQQQHIAEYDYSSQDITLDKAQEMGRFNMGSTVILVTAQNVNWHSSLRSSVAINFGQQLAEFQ